MPPGIYPRRVKRHAVTQPLDKPYRYIPLTQGQNAIVDAADYEWLSQWNWHAYFAKNVQSFGNNILDSAARCGARFAEGRRT